MAKRRCTASGISDELVDILNKFVEQEEEIIQEVFKETADDTKEMVAAKSPNRNGAYASGWQVKAEKAGKLGQDVHYSVCNPAHYQLTHLLEKGHAVVNQYGTPTRSGAKKRVRGQRHIKPAERQGNALLVERLMEKL